MNRLAAKIAILLASAIILLHAMVPHHHHDCNHDCDDHHSDHPFDICRLADMLSHLVLNTKEDDNLLALVVKAEVHNLFMAVLPSMDRAIQATESELYILAHPDKSWSLPLPPLAGGHSLRAPPMCA